MARLDIFTGLIPTSTPQLRWSTAVGGEVGCRAVLAPGGRLVVGDKGKKITVLDCATGATLWSKTLSYPTYYGSPAVDSAGNVYVATWRELISYDPTGAVRWRTSFSAISQAPLQVGDQGDLYVVSAPIISGRGAVTLSWFPECMLGDYSVFQKNHRDDTLIHDAFSDRVRASGRFDCPHAAACPRLGQSCYGLHERHLAVIGDERDSLHPLAAP